MAGSKSEIDLIIKATDDTSKVINTVKKAFNDFIGVQASAVKGGKELNTAFASTVKEAATLQKQIGGLKALGTIAESATEAAAALDRIGSAVKRQETDVVNLGKTYNDAATATKRLREQMDAEQAVLNDTKAARDAERASLKAYGDQIKVVKGQLKDLRDTAKGSNKTDNLAQSSIEGPGGSQAATIAANLRALQTQQAKSKADIEAYNAAIKDQDASIKSLNPVLTAAEKNERSLNAARDKSVQALDRENASFTQATNQYRELSQITAQAAQLSGVEVTNQEKVAAAYAKTTAELARANAAIAEYNAASSKAITGDISSSKTTRTTGPTGQSQVTAIDPNRKAAIEQLRDLQTQLASAQTEAQKFSKALAQADAPTIELGAAAGTAQARVRVLKEQIDSITTALRASSGSFAAWSQSAGKVNINPIHALNAEIAAIRPAASEAANGADKLASSITASGNSSREALSVFQRLRAEVLSLTAGYIGLQAAIGQIGGVINAFQSLEGAQSRLGAVFNQDTNAVSKELDFLQSNADRLGISFQTLADQYSKFAIAAKSANFQSEATRKIFISVAEAGRVNKLSVDQLNGVFLALEQMISKGKVSSEELRRQLGDRLPGAFSIFAAALGKSTAELDKLMREGQVISDQSTLMKFADELTKRFGPQLSASLQTTSAELGRFSNNIFEAQLRVAQGGFIDAFTKGLAKLNEAFQSKAGHDFFLSLGAAMGRVVDGIVVLSNHATSLLGIFGAFAAVKILGVFQSLTARILETAGAAGASGASFFSFQANLAALEAKVNGFKAALSPTSGLIGAFRTQLIGAAGAAAIAGPKFVVMQSAIGAVRVAAGVAAGAFRLLWSAIGGLPGIVLTGVTIALGQWLTKVNDTVSAIDEHRRILQAVQLAYDKIKGTTNDIKDNIKGVTLAQAIDSADKLKEKIDQGYKSMQGLARVLFAGNSDMPSDSPQIKQYNEIADAIERVKKGESSLKDLSETLSNIALNPADSQFKDVALELLNMINNAGEGKTSLQELADAYSQAEAVVKVFKDTATDADAAVIKNADDQTQATDNTKKMTDQTAALNDILGTMNKTIEKTGDEFKRLETINGLEKQYQDALKLAQTMGQVYRINEQYQKSINDSLDHNIGSNSTIVDKIIGAESGGNANAANPNSSAQGLGQFISSTWLSMFKKYFPDRAAGMSDAMILELRKDSELNRSMVALYVQENAKVLQQAGQATTDANLYLAHFLGAGDALKVLGAAPGTPLKGLISDASIAANPSVLGGGKTTNDAMAFAAKKTGGTSPEEAKVNERLLDIDTKREQKAKDYTTDLESRLSIQAQEIDNAGKLTQEAYVQKALDAEMKKAREAGVTLSDQQIDLIKQQAAAEYDNKQAKVEGNQAQKDANAAQQVAVALASQRNALEKQFKDAQASGNVDLTATLQTQLTDVNSQLTDAIGKARGMWEAIGGDEARAKITALDTLKVKVNASTKSYGLLGLKAQDVQSLVGSGVDGLVGVFDSFAEAIANGQNAFKAIGTAFLQFAANFLKQIAEMILKQTILNLLARMGGSIGSAATSLGGIAAAAAHTGGVVGGSRVGTGNSNRTVGAGVFAAAMRYHDGGVAGLRPNEVPTILQKGEEVLTKDDPRHRDNAGAMSGAASAQAVAIRNVITLDPSFAADMISSASSERALLSVLKKNKATLQNLVNS